MSNKTIVSVIVGFFVLVLGMSALLYVQNQTAPAENSVATSTQATSTDPYKISRIEAKHFYRDGVNTIVGELTMPTPCDLLTTDARVAESMPEQVTFIFDVVNTTTECESTPTKQRFSVSASASNQASLSATFRGFPVELNLIEAGKDETPESYELYIKG